MIYGVDISHHNGAVNFENLKGTGKCDFVVIRVCHGLTMDTRFSQNLAGAKSAGLPYVFYWYSEADSIADGQAEAKFVLSKIAGTKPLFVAFDAEYSALQAQSKNTTTDIIDKSLYLVKQAGFVPWYYTNENWRLNEVDTAFLKSKGYKLWYARYTGQTPENANYSSLCDMWQYSQNGILQGNGSQYIDLDVCYDMDTIKQIDSASFNPNYCDTTIDFSIAFGKTYQFRTGSPITCGTGSVFKQVSQAKDGNFYLTKFQAIGRGTAGFYISGKRIVIGTVK